MGALISHLKLRQRIIEICREMVQTGLTVGTWGNVAVRLPDNPETFMVTPSGLDYFALEPEDLVIVDMEERVREGHRKYSSETPLHREILQHRPDINAVIHNHSPWASAFCGARRPLPPISEDLVCIVGGGVPVTTYVPGHEHHKLAREARETMGADLNAVLLAGHGPLACGPNLEQAFIASRVVEKAAQMYILAQMIGGAVELPPEAVAAEREFFRCRYGQGQHNSRGNGVASARLRSKSGAR